MQIKLEHQCQWRFEISNYTSAISIVHAVHAQKKWPRHPQQHHLPSCDTHTYSTLHNRVTQSVPLLYYKTEASTVSCWHSAFILIKSLYQYTCHHAQCCGFCTALCVALTLNLSLPPSSSLHTVQEGSWIPKLWQTHIFPNQYRNINWDQKSAWLWLREWCTILHMNTSSSSGKLQCEM